MRERVNFAVGCDATVDKLMEYARQQGRRERRMTEKRKADLEAALAELAFEIDLAIEQGLPDNFQWVQTFVVRDESWIALMNIAKVVGKT